MGRAWGPGAHPPDNIDACTLDRCALSCGSCCTTGTVRPASVNRALHVERRKGGERTRAVSSGSTVQSIWKTSGCANSAHRGSAVYGGCAKDDARNARTSRTRGPLPGSWIIGCCSRTSVGSCASPCALTCLWRMVDGGEVMASRRGVWRVVMGGEIEPRRSGCRV